jgi:hypothetical protein
MFFFELESRSMERVRDRISSRMLAAAVEIPRLSWILLNVMLESTKGLLYVLGYETGRVAAKY